MSERIMLDCKLRIARSEFRRSFRQFVMAFAVIAASAIPSFAGETTTPTYSQALDALYNLDFSDAEHAFSSLVGEDPPNPDYWNGLASTIWMKILYDQRKFNIDSYSGSSIGTTRSHDSVNPDDEKRLRDGTCKRQCLQWRRDASDTTPPGWPSARLIQQNSRRRAIPMQFSRARNPESSPVPSA